jgi:hypothetical protein
MFGAFRADADPSMIQVDTGQWVLEGKSGLATECRSSNRNSGIHPGLRHKHIAE